MWTRIFGVGLLLAALAGVAFASVSTLDFVQHLDRQVHDLHCSFAPGLVEADEESTGCQVTLLSPYSSIMRTSLWGGIPISLPAMAVFAFLAFRAIELLLAPPARRRTMAAIALAATGVPVLASIVMGYVAFTELHAACKLCIGIYISSGSALLMALGAWLAARREDEGSLPPMQASAQAPPRAAAAWLAAAGQAFGFVTVPVVTYALLVPDYSRYIGTCGALAEPDDPYGVMVPLGPQGGGVPTIEVLDPLCPSCRGLEERLTAAGQAERLSRRVVLFPLDSECNWMVGRSLHPGACRVSQAVLCAAQLPTVGADAVVQWSFEQQEAILAAGKAGSQGVDQMITARFPELAACLGSPEVESRLNKSLRWAVKNELPVMTPQIYVAGVKLCDEDSDLGLDFTLHHMLERHAKGELRSTTPAAAAPAEPALVPGSEAGKRAAGSEAKPKATKPKATKPKAATPKPAPPEPAEPKPAEPKQVPPASELPDVADLPEPADDGEDEGAP